MRVIGKDLFEIVEKMPAFPQSVHRVLELTSDIDSDPKILVEVIQHDPILVTKILRLVNSPYFGLAQKMTSINHAVVYIGINTVKNLALSAATLGVLPRTNAAGFDMDAFLMHSLATAIVARILGRKLHVPEREVFDYFLSGLPARFRQDRLRPRHAPGVQTSPGAGRRGEDPPPSGGDGGSDRGPHASRGEARGEVEPPRPRRSTA